MLLFCDSFDHYDTATLAQKYLSISNANIVSGGRTGNCLQLHDGGGVTKPSQNSSKLIVGFAFNPQIVSNYSVVNFYDLGVLQGYLRLTTAGGIEYCDGANNVLAASPNGIITPGDFAYVEIKVVFATTATGSVAAQVNGMSAFSQTGVTTSLSGNNYANLINLTNGSIFNSPELIDDLYICDGSGTVNNDFLGDVGVVCLFPNGNGQHNQFSQVGGTAGQNWTCVDDNPATDNPCPDGDTTYVYSSTVGNQDFYAIQAVGSPQAIVGVQIVASARKDDSYTRVLGLGFGNGTTSVFDSGFSLGSNYQMYTQPYDQNPITSGAWDITHLDNGQIGLQVIS